eukprot:SAG22_NODE_18647_length_283_cov_1.347826_1_plen_21_part_10
MRLVVFCKTRFGASLGDAPTP